MKNNIRIIILIVISLSIASCSKNHPGTGRYSFSVKYVHPFSDEKWTEIHIIESSRNYILTNYNSKLDKRGKKITGVVYSFGRPMYLDGEWTYNIFKNKSYIKGTFKELISSGTPQYFATGTFEMKPF